MTESYVLVESRFHEIKDQPPYWNVRNISIRRTSSGGASKTMKIVMGGSESTDDVKTTIGHLFDSFKSSGVDQISGLDLYLKPYSDGRPAVLVAHDGSPIEQLELDPPFKEIFHRRFTSRFGTIDDFDKREYLALLRLEVDRVCSLLE